jgi:ribonucleotide monophosphatase NagD (HAD superfamily)
VPLGKCMLQAIGIKDVLSVRLTGCAAVLPDLDGCLISGEPVLGGVPKLFDRVGDVLWIVSNNSTDATISLSARLAGMGLTIAPGRIFLAGEQTLRRIAAEQPGARIALNAAAPMHDLARDLGLIADRKHPQLCASGGAATGRRAGGQGRRSG